MYLSSHTLRAVRRKVHFELTVGAKTRVLEAGDVWVIPGDVAHSGKALTACRVLDVFHPVREDYR